MSKLTETMDQAVKAMANQEGKYLTFTLAEEEYGISILKHAYPINTGWCWGYDPAHFRLPSDSAVVLHLFPVGRPEFPSGAYPAALRVLECSSCVQLGGPLALGNQMNLC
jgi:hypothetical protein